MRKFWFALAFPQVLAACGGGDDSSAPAPTPSPAPIATPTPTPSPTPTPPLSPVTINFTTPFVGYREISTGREVIAPAVDGDATVTVFDPDAQQASRFEDFVFNGDETVKVERTGLYNQVFSAANYSGILAGTFVNPPAEARSVPVITQRISGGTAASATLESPQLEVRRMAAPETANRGKFPKHVRLLQFTRQSEGGFHLVGTRTPLAALPRSGKKVYVGEVYVTKSFASGERTSAIGVLELTVDFSAATEQVRGTLTITNYNQAQSSLRPGLRLEVVGTLTDNTFDQADIQLRGPNAVEAGHLRGAFYGDLADEIGIIFSAMGASGTTIGGALAGAETSN